MPAGHDVDCLKGHALVMLVVILESDTALAKVPAAHTVHVRSAFAVAGPLKKVPAGHVGD